MSRSRLPKGFDLTDPSVLGQGRPDEDFAELRRSAPVSWIRQARGSSGFDDEGYWAVLWLGDLNRDGWSASLFTGLDLEALTRHLGPDWVVLLRGHSFNARHDLTDRSTARVIDVTHHHDINHLYLSADALLTDYSSAMFDFCVLGRPILYFVPDLEQYVDARGVYFDLETVAPGPWCRTQADLHAALDELHDYDRRYSHRYSAFKERFAPWDDGKAASRVVEAFFLD